MTVSEILELLGDEDICVDTLIKFYTGHDSTDLKIVEVDIYVIELQQDCSKTSIRDILVLIMENQIIGSTEIRLITDIELEITDTSEEVLMVSYI